MASTRGRQVVLLLTNKSGGAVAAGDVVIVDTTNDTAFTTTTTGASQTSVGIAQETIANNAIGRVLTHGYATLINVPSSVTRGHYIQTNTVAKQAVGNSTRQAGSFGQFLTGGSSPTGLIWGVPDQTASGGGSSYAGVGSTERALVDPTGLSWSWTNQGSATITTVGAALLLHDPAGSSDSQRIRKKAVPSRPYTIYVHLIPNIIPKNTTSISVGWFQSSDGHFVGFNQYYASGSGGALMGVGKSGTNYQFTADYIGTPPAVIDYWRWVKLTDASGGNRTVSVSRDGNDWILFHSVATNDFITPTDVYFSVTSNNGSTFDAGVIVDSWEEA